MEFSGINLLSLIFCASLPELIRMVVKVCASNYLTSNLRAEKAEELWNLLQPLPVLPINSLSFISSLSRGEKIFANKSREHI